MSKSSILGQIKELQERNALGKNLGMFTRFDDIERILNEIEYKKIENTEAVYQYIPLATVACTEGFFRFAVKTLIDHGTPFIEKVSDLEKRLQLKISLDIVAEIQAKSLTIGELVAHVVPCNKLEDIDSAISILLGKGFLETIKTHSRPNGLVQEDKQKEFNKGYAEVFNDIKRLFEIRHILAHEIAPGYHLDKTEIIRCYNNTKSFIIQFTDFLLYSIDPDQPVTAADGLAREQKRADHADEELENLLSKRYPINGFLTIVQPEFSETKEATIEAWKNYRDTRARHAAATQSDPTASRISYLQNYVATTKAMINDLNIKEVLY